ncbi:Kip1p [Sugiyamaella lignohabitans]|uniref:Kinesin-like protein n=1 Tax=Sugiyamaella lignohabitans TaxID=796027 RepID=A0A167FRC5_9ASCO|nr:Kip1p [Sugiyamaella lignohabitans]ANB15602.1 Kip1p [Sugiyamaella lignohabitans]
MSSIPSCERTLSRASMASDPGGSNGVPSPSTSSGSNNIKVIARFRPENSLEKSDPDAINIVQFLSDSTCKIETKDFNGTFTFDRVFNMDSAQQQVFDYSLRPTVEDIFKGYNGTVLAYGQTGSGKSYTMMGPSIDDGNSRGAIPRIVDLIFDTIQNSSSDIEYMVRVSYMEIYMEKIKDLLNPTNDNLPIHEDKTRGVYVKGLTEEYVSCANDVYQVMRQGSRIRSVAATNMNQESSRSHSIFVIVVSQKNIITGSQKTGQMFLVDLAGSEKVGKTGASGQTLEEAKKINKSLSALGLVINSLTDSKSSHIPYRDSKLTRILQESLGGNSRTSLIVNCSPSSYNDAETLSTLRFGVRAKTIKNKAKINAELSPTELRQLLRQSQTTLESRVRYEQKLEAELLLWRSGTSPSKSDWTDLLPYSVPQSPRTGSSMSYRSSSTVTPLRRGVAARPGHRSTMSNVSTLNDVSYTIPMSPTPSEFGFENENDSMNFLNSDTLQDQLTEKDAIIEQQEELISKLKETVQQVEESRQLILEIDNLKYDKKELEIKICALEDDNKDLSTRLDVAMKEALELSIKNSEVDEKSAPSSPNYDTKRRKKMSELLGDMYTDEVSISNASLLELLQLSEDLPEKSRIRAIRVLNNLSKQMDSSDLPGPESSATFPVSPSPSTLSTSSTRTSSVSFTPATYIIDLLKQENERFSSILSTHSETNADSLYQAKLQSQLETIEQLMSKVDVLNREKAALQSSVEELNDTIQLQKTSSEKTAALQAHIAQFETMKASLMTDLQDRCERIVELEISLDQARDQYNLALRNSNNKQQQKKMALLQRNLEQLTRVQRQLIEQNAQLKKEVVIDEKLLVVRNERIEALEESLRKSEQMASEDRELFAKNLALLREHLSDFRPKQEELSHVVNIVKPLRGGGGRGVATGINDGNETPPKEGIWTRLNHYVNS